MQLEYDKVKSAKVGETVGMKAAEWRAKLAEQEGEPESE